MKKKNWKNGSFCNFVYFVRVTDFWFEQICGEYYTVVLKRTNDWSASHVFPSNEFITKNNWVIDECILELVREHQIRLGNIHERKCLCSIWRWFCVAFICFKRCFYALIHCRRKHWFIFNWVDVNDCEWPALKWYEALGLSPLGYIPINYLNYPTNLSLSDSCIYIRSGICWRFFSCNIHATLSAANQCANIFACDLLSTPLK